MKTGIDAYDLGVNERNSKRMEGWRKTAAGETADLRVGDGVQEHRKEIGWADVTYETIATPSSGALEYLASAPTHSSPTPPLAGTPSSQLVATNRSPSIRIHAAPSCSLEKLGTCLCAPAPVGDSDMAMDDLDSVAPDPNVRICGCEHVFHSQCLAAALRVRGFSEEADALEKPGAERNDLSVRCPVCRKNGTVAEVEKVVLGVQEDDLGVVAA
ncbi:hypothetical protein HDU93_001869 [Gonapodya sp. JEL0774]|nr:hypothetical protein HDU93_001869 [Gonapodya sp. JEL0774]